MASIGIALPFAHRFFHRLFEIRFFRTNLSTMTF
jgi:hypothetical protein